MSLKAVSFCFFFIFVGCYSFIADKDFQSFMEYEMKFNLTFASEERFQRFAIFKENLIRIEQWNKEMPSATFGVTQFTHLTDEEVSKFLLPSSIMDTPRPDEPKDIPYSGKIPSYFNWRDRGVVTGVKNQGSCGSCYTFAAAAAVESMYAIKTGVVADLSEQQILDCDSQSKGCDWGYLYTALDLARDVGLVPYGSYPYEGRKGNCRTPSNARRTRITGNTWLKADENLIANTLYSQGPVAIIFNYPRALLQYTGGVFNMDTNTCYNQRLGNHMAVLVGYKYGEYWIAKNSWGTNWGEGGYFRIAMGRNVCSMTMEPRIVHI